MEIGKEQLAEGTLVKFDFKDGVTFGEGVICGQFNNGVLVLGLGYIIRHTKLSVPYEYSTVAVFEYHIDLIPSVVSPREWDEHIATRNETHGCPA